MQAFLHFSSSQADKQTMRVYEIATFWQSEDYDPYSIKITNHRQSTPC